MVLEKILLTGGSGKLGTELQKISDVFVSPSSRELNIVSANSVGEYLSKMMPSVVVHAAAYTDVPNAESEIEKVIETNVVGTYNILKWCVKNGAKMVYISTDYVFDGERGNYSPTDPINPLTNYAKSKASAEMIVGMYENSLTIRTSFYGRTFPYEKALEDQWTTKDYVDIMAPKILKECLSEKTGIIHCYSKKRTIFELAKLRKKDVLPMKSHQLDTIVPKDTSLIGTKL